jgi:hypothetical protein
VAPEARSWAALGGRESVVVRVSSGGWRWGMELTAGARLTERRGRGGRLGRREPKGKTYFPRRRDRRVGWMGQPGRYWPVGAARPVGWLGQRPSGPQSWLGRNQEKEFPN